MAKPAGSSVSRDRERWYPALEEMFAPFSRSDAPGGAVAVALNGRAVFRRAFGLANLEHAVANTPRTRFRIASVTKQFTSLAVLLLAERGKLDIEASIRRYVPELGEQSGEPSLRQLMNHTSGYRCYIDLGFIADGCAVHPAADALELQRLQTRGNFPPGQRLLYCNGGYSLLSLAIERVSGDTFETVMEDLIFEPLEMRDTRVVPSDREVHAQLASMYVPSGREWKHWNFFTEGLRGDGGIISSVDDMLRWARHLREPTKIGSAETWRELTRPSTLSNGFVSPYALGLEVFDYRGVRVIRHSGGVVGGSSLLLSVPEHALDVFLVTNGASLPVVELSMRIIETVLGESVFRPKVEEAKADTYPYIRGKYYCAETGMLLGIQALDDRLGVSLLGGAPIVAEQTDDGVVVPFLKTGAGHYVISCARGTDGASGGDLFVSDTGNVDRYLRITDANPSMDDIRPKLTGSFYAPEARAKAVFHMTTDRPVLTISGPFGTSTWDLRPLTDSLLVAVNVAFPVWTAIIRLSSEPGEFGAFEMSTRRTRRLEFNREASR